jgi:hypothetical protein
MQIECSRSHVVEWLWSGTSNHISFTAVGSNPSLTLDSCMWESYPGSLRSGDGFPHVPVWRRQMVIKDEDYDTALIYMYMQHYSL